MAGFNINHLQGLTTTKIFCTFAIEMLLKTLIDIGADTCVQAVVATVDNIHRPIHII